MQTICKSKEFAFLVERIEKMLHILEHALEHTMADVLGLLPFLFLTYLAMELLEHYAGNKFNKVIQNSGKWGPFAGAVLGVMPQCGFSAAAASFYSGRVIGVGTLLAYIFYSPSAALPLP